MRTNRRNYYRILHVQPDAPAAVIRTSYRTLMQKLRMHPDLGGDHAVAALLNEALEVLGDAQKRERYDRQISAYYKKRSLGGMGHSQPRRSASPSPGLHARRHNGDPRSGERRTMDGACAFCRTPFAHDTRLKTEATCAICHSPLLLAPKLELERSCQRAIKRIPKDHAIIFYTKWPQIPPGRGDIRDLSPNGLLFFSRQPLQKHQVIKISSSILDATGRVANSRPPHSDRRSMFAIGVEFITVQFQQPHGTFISIKA